MRRDRGEQPRVVIRPYRSEDRQAVRDIVCGTAFRSIGSDAVFEDRDRFADYWSLYYTDFEPESAWVAERDERLVGHLFGCVDSRRYVRVMASRVVPRVLLSVGLRWAAGRYRRPESRRFLRWVVCHAWREVPPVPVETYPAHYHVNLLPAAHGQGLYSCMAIAFVDRLAARGVDRIHGMVFERASGGSGQRILNDYQKNHPTIVEFESSKPTRFAADVLADPRPFVNRAYGFRVDAFRSLLVWMQETHGL